MSAAGSPGAVLEPRWDDLEPVTCPAALAADERWRLPASGPLVEPAPPGTALLVPPYCTCPGRVGYRDRGDGKYRCGACMRPSRMVWEKSHNDGVTVEEWAGRLAAQQAPPLAVHAGRTGDSVPDVTTTGDWMQDAIDSAAREHDAGPPFECGRDCPGCSADEDDCQCPQAPAGSIKVSNSELRAFKRCRRKWWLSYYRRLTLRREGVGPLSLGNMVHKPLEAYYGTPNRDPETFDWRTPLAAYVEARLADPALPDHLHERMLQDYELVKIMLEGYFEWLQNDGADSDLEILAPEREVEAFLGEVEGQAVWLIGKLDVEARRRSDGRKTFVDHKSCQTLSDIPKTGKLDEQVKTYGLLQRLEAVARGDAGRTEYADGGTWNMLRKVKRTASAKPPFYGRAGVSHNDEVYRTFFKRVWGEVRDMLYVRRALDAGGDHQEWAYANPTRDCSWDCPFFQVCDQFDDGSDVESVVAMEYVEHDPYERYTEVEKG